MKTSMKFGECLKILLTTFDISMNRLSKAINVDSSLVNRWIHGKRIPPLSTSYIDNISEYLSKYVLNSFQLKQLDDVFLKVCDNCREPLGNKEKIRLVLLETQGYSLECIKKNKKTDKINFLPNILELSNEDKIISGTKNVFNAAVQLLKSAAEQKHKQDNTIYISFNNDSDLLSAPSPKLIFCQNLLLKAIENGWKVLFLLRFNNNMVRTIRFINFAKPLILTGKLITYYFKEYDALSSGAEAVIIPDIGALACFLTKPYSGIDSALCFTNTYAIHILSSYFNALISSHSQPLITYYPEIRAKEYSRYLMKNEESIGSRYFNKYNIGLLLLPEGLYRRLLERSSVPKEEIHIALDYYKRRLSAFLLNVRHYEYKDIFFMESIRHLTKYHQLYFYYNSGIELMNVTVSEIIELLNNVISLLQCNANYHIALVQESKQNELFSSKFDCLVKERKAVFLEGYDSPKHTPRIRLSIEEPMLVKALEEYYKSIWGQIAPIHKDKEEIIRFFEHEIKILNDKR